MVPVYQMHFISFSSFIYFDLFPLSIAGKSCVRRLYCVHVKARVFLNAHARVFTFAHLYTCTSASLHLHMRAFTSTRARRASLILVRTRSSLYMYTRLSIHTRPCARAGMEIRWFIPTIPVSVQYFLLLRLAVEVRPKSPCSLSTHVIHSFDFMPMWLGVYLARASVRLSLYSRPSITVFVSVFIPSNSCQYSLLIV